MNQPPPAPDHARRMDRVRCSLEGLSVGDALGERFFWHPEKTAWLIDDEEAAALIARRRLPEPPWPYTDDTEMALGIAEVLSRCGHVDRDELGRVFAARFWKDPSRGYGATAVEILQGIHRGTPWREAAGRAFGGEGSMGNGGAMRAAPVGAYFADDPDAAAAGARASAEVTHAHPEGQAGAMAVAVAAATAFQLRGRPAAEARDDLFATVLRHTPRGLTSKGIAAAAELASDATVVEAVERLGNGSRVIAPDTVPFALWCAARHLDNYAEAIWTTVSGLGDRDTTCAIAGGIVALATGAEAIPAEWRAAREELSIEW